MRGSSAALQRHRFVRVIPAALTVLLFVSAASLFAWAVPKTLRLVPTVPSSFWLLSLLAVVSEVPLVRGAHREGVPPSATVSVCFAFPIFFLWGAAPAIVVQALAAAVSALTRGLNVGWGAFLTARLVVALAVAELTVYLLGGHLITSPQMGLTARDVLDFAPAALAWMATSFAILVVARWGFKIGSVRASIDEVRGDLLSVSAGILLASPLLTVLTGWWSLVIALPLIALNRISPRPLHMRQRLRREPVTGLLDRSGLQVGLASLTARDLLGLQPRPFAIVFVNVESVLAVSRSLGRGVYEKVAALAATRLGQAFGTDQVGRLAGEGFVIILPDLSGPEALAEAERAVRMLDDPLEVDGIPFALDPAAGVALSPEHGRDLATLVGNAELAMADARSTGRKTELYLPGSADHVQRRLDILAAVGATLEDPTRRSGEITLLYQPQIDLQTRSLVGVEALVRWNGPGWGPVPTDELIAAIESSQIMHMLTDYVVREAVAQIAAWNKEGMATRVSINVSANDLRSDRLLEVIRSAMSTAGVRTEQLAVEITESALVTDWDRISRTARAIAASGITVSLDDYGTGYASVQQLLRLPISEIKLDRTYVAGITTDRTSEAIIRSVHQLAGTLGLSVVAEGIEDEATEAALSKLPGIIGQGWQLGKPMPASELRRWWR